MNGRIHIARSHQPRAFSRGERAYPYAAAYFRIDEARGRQAEAVARVEFHRPLNILKTMRSYRHSLPGRPTWKGQWLTYILLPCAGSCRLIGDLVERLYMGSSATHLIYTNVDIILPGPDLLSGGCSAIRTGL